MTRGRDSTCCTSSPTTSRSTRQFIDALLDRDHADRGLQAATSDAQVDVAGLAAQGRLKVDNVERARLVEVIEQPSGRRRDGRTPPVCWPPMRKLTRARKQPAEYARSVNSRARLAGCPERRLRPLLDSGHGGRTVYLEAHAERDEAWDASRSAGRLGRRAAQRRLNAARQRPRRTCK